MKTGLVIAVPALLLVALLAGCDNGDSQSQAAVGTAAVIDPVGGGTEARDPPVAATPTQAEITAAARAALAGMQASEMTAAPPPGEAASNLLPTMPSVQGSNLLPSMQPPPRPMPAPVADNTAPAEAFWTPAPVSTPATPPSDSEPATSFWPLAPATAADANAPAARAAGAPAEPAPADGTIPYPLPLPPEIRDAEQAGEPQGDAPATAQPRPVAPIASPSTPEKPADSAAAPPPAQAAVTPPQPPAGASPATPPAGAAPSASPTPAASAPATPPPAPATAAPPPASAATAPAAPPDFYHADTNFDARIEFDEAQKIWPQLTRKQFEAADLDGSGSLNGDEYALVVKHPPPK